VFFGAREWRPGTVDGRRLIAHELTHVVQQGNERGLRRQSTGQQPRLFETAAAESRPFSEALQREWDRLVTADNSDGALRALVAEMVRRGELDTRLLTTDGVGEQWVIEEVADRGAMAHYPRPPIRDPADATQRLPNPRFRIDPVLFRVGRGLARCHSVLLHEFRHVQQREELLNRPQGTGQPVVGYCNDPNEFDAYLSEIEAAHDDGTLFSAGVAASVIWLQLAASDRGVFAPRWQAAQAKIQERLSFTVEVLRGTSNGQRVEAECERSAAAARAAWERNAPNAR
jgi:hypothetical protein